MNMIDLLFLLTPLGIYILIISIKGIRKFTKQKVIYEVPYHCGGGTFTISEEEKKYAIYLSGKAYTKNPIANIKPCVRNNATQKEVRVAPCILRTSVTGSDGTGRVELATFKAAPGQYTICFAGKGLAIDRAMSHVADAIKPNSDYSSFKIQIREYCSFVILFFYIWGIILGSMAAMSGMILPLALR